MNPADRMRVMETCLVLPGAGWLMHFVLMMAMSVIVAIMGLSADSPALVIGAMLIAPLMTPVLGIAASIAMALGDATARSVVIVVCATAGAIGLAWVVAGWLPDPLLTNEVLARTAPDVRDLVVALAAGVAGSYATARPDVSSSLPGVAIAVALVPPLAVVGIAMRAGEAALAKGALLLYGTNLAAIVTVSTIVFVLAGFVPGRRLASMAPRVVAGGLVGLALVVALAVTLYGRTVETSNEARQVAAIRAAAQTWLEGSFNEHEVEVDGSTVRIRVTGPDELPPSSELAREIEGIVGEDADLRVTWFQAETETSDSLRAARAADEAVSRWQGQADAIDRAIEQWLGDDPAAPAYEVTSVTVDSSGVLVQVASAIQPPPLKDLAAQVEAELGDPVPVSQTWRDLSVEAAEAERQRIDEISANARIQVQEWALGHGVDVESVVYDGDTLVVDLLGTTAPAGDDLETRLAQVVPSDTQLLVYLLPREPVIPAPTPTATPTPVPTSTPVPTVTPQPVDPVDTEGDQPDAEPESGAGTDETDSGDSEGS